MSRPLRLEFPGAIYHVTSRGDRREPIYRDDGDRMAHLKVLEQATDRFDAQLLAYCQMGNHYHLVLHTRQANLSRFMRHMNGVYTQRFNRRHGLVGHLLQGRFKAILVDRDAYLLSLCRYVERNPLAAGLVPHPADWPWSSCRAHLGMAPTPAWLDSDGLHGYLLGHTLRSSADRKRATSRYAELIQQDDCGGLWQQGLRNQVFLGDEEFVRRSLDAHAPMRKSAEVPRLQHKLPVSLAELLESGESRDQAVHAAYTTYGFTMTQLAQELGLSVSRISRIVARVEAERGSLAIGKT